MEFRDLRRELAATFRWAARLDLHESVANHFSVLIPDMNGDFLMNPNCMHFSRIRASDLLRINARDEETLNQENAPDPSAWGLHGAIYRFVPWARCAFHLHPPYSTVLATLQDPELPPIDQNTATFFRRTVVDDGFGGLVMGDEGERVAKLFSTPNKRTMIMGNHGLLVLGRSLSEAWNTLYYFERAARTYILALQTGRPLKVLSDEIALRTAAALNGDTGYTDVIDAHLKELMLILDREGSDYCD